MQIEEMRLDGNAAGGVLREVFTHEMTPAFATCAGCATMGPVGALLAYGHGMGIVLRCPTCDAPAMRIVRRPGFLCLDLSGMSLLTIPESDSVS
jgi:hypothetical protein